MADANWKNRTIFTGDNLHVMRGMNSDSVDLIYLDPPFNSNRYYEAPIGSRAAGSAFKDAWHLDDVDEEWHYLIGGTHPGLFDLLNATKTIHGKRQMAYLIYMSIRLMEMRRILKPTGSIYLHCDWHASHYLKLIMDDIFGASNFGNEITWLRSNPHSDARNRYPSVSDSIFYYAGKKAFFDPVYVMPPREKILERYRYEDENGRYATSPLHARGLRSGYQYTWEVETPYGARSITDTWRYPEERLDELNEKGLVHWPKK